LASAAGALGSGDELLVVESGEGGVTSALAELNPNSSNVEWPRIRHLRIEMPGKSRQVNLGIRATTADILLLTDDDVLVPKSWPSEMARSFDDPRVGAAFGSVRGLTMAPGFEAPPRVLPGEAPYETWDFAHGAAMALRRSAVLQIGGFDERLGPGSKAHGEEHDVVWRLRARQWKVVIADAPAMEHLEWRTEAEKTRNALVYERGSGAIVGAAIRRSPSSGFRVLKRRLAYQRMVIDADHRFGVRALIAFAGGVLYGLRLGERDWLE
jgi:GT2 family glycosyltransferase